MINQLIVEILVNRIKSGWKNPKTNLPLAADDILNDEYKIVVQEVLQQEQSKDQTNE